MTAALVRVVGSEPSTRHHNRRNPPETWKFNRREAKARKTEQCESCSMLSSARPGHPNWHLHSPAARRWFRLAVGHLFQKVLNTAATTRGGTSSRRSAKPRKARDAWMRGTPCKFQRASRLRWHPPHHTLMPIEYVSLILAGMFCGFCLPPLLTNAGRRHGRGPS